MKKIKSFNLKTENLVIDYLTLNYKLGKPFFENQIIFQMFHHYKFNCYWLDAGSSVKILNPCNGFVNNSYKYRVNFVLNSNPSNSGLILLQFSGLNASYFYQILKTGGFRWDFFDNNIIVSRLDLCYLSSTLYFDKVELERLLEIFYKESIIKFKKRYPRAEVQILKGTLSLGTRTGDYFLRVYQNVNANSLKYELEIKKYKARILTNLLIHCEFEQIEQQIIENFYNYLKIALYLDTSLTNWLCLSLRRSEKKIDSIVSNYLMNKYIPRTLVEQKYFYEVLQFISFTRQLNYKLEKLNDVEFYSYVFPLTDFAKWLDIYPLTTYRRMKVLQFFDRLISFPPDYGWFCNFSNHNKNQLFYISPFPVLIYEQKKNKPIKIRLSVSKLFYDYSYPFYLPTKFISYKNKNDLRVKYKIVEAIILNLSPVKKLFLDDIFSLKTNNKNKTILKKYLINGLKDLKKENLIKHQVKLELVELEKKIEIDNLTPKLLNSCLIINFYEKLE